MGQCVADNFKDLTAAVIVMPPLLVRTARIVTVVDVTLPGLVRGLKRWDGGDFPDIGKFGLVALAAERAVELLHGLTRKC